MAEKGQAPQSRTDWQKALVSLARDSRLQSPEAERIVIGSVLKEAGALGEVIPLLPDQDRFYDKRHQLIYKTTLELYLQGKPYDFMAVTEELARQNELTAAGGRVYVTECAESVISTASVTTHAASVLDYWKRRKAIRMAADAISGSVEGQDTDHIVGDLQNGLFGLLGGIGGGFERLGDVAGKFRDFIDECMTGEIYKKLVRTGFKTIDAALWGMLPGSLTIVGAKTSHGKTQLAMQMLENNAAIGIPGAMLSIEMGKIELLERLACSLCHIDADRIRFGKLTDDEMVRLDKAITRAQDLPIYVDDFAGTTLPQLMANTVRAILRHKIKFVIVDYLQIMEHPNRERDDLRIGELSRGLKLIARNCGIPVIALSQFNRGVGDDEPQLSHLRGSGSIEQDADNVLFPWHWKEDGVNYAKVILAKRRGGKINRDIPMAWKDGRWHDLERRHAA